MTNGTPLPAIALPQTAKVVMDRMASAQCGIRMRCPLAGSCNRAASEFPRASWHSEFVTPTDSNSGEDERRFIE